VYGDEGRLKISFVSPDCFVPLRVDGERVTEAAFISQTRKGDKYYTLVESHRWDGADYVIQNELFESDSSADLGVKVALPTLYPDLTDEVRIENLERPMFVYLKPNEANNFDPQSPLGISIY
ncbi:poly(3-hydroxybutyrate) depolymerase, partial [Algoriphagus aestuarii]|nr:poly(3-hydroxybutyrate) depolymerase [Algoriphagus aestuarii]